MSLRTRSVNTSNSLRRLDLPLSDLAAVPRETPPAASMASFHVKHTNPES